MTEHAHPFAGAEIIYEYSTKQAVEDGIFALLDQAEVAELVRQHYKWPVCISQGVVELIQASLRDPKQCNDFNGVLHDILSMSHSRLALQLSPSLVEFKVLITGTGAKRLHTMRASCGPWCSTDPRPVISIYLPEED